MLGAAAPNLAVKAGQFMSFKSLAYKAGFAKQTPRKVDITTRATYDSDGAQESSTNEFTLDFFADTSAFKSRKTQQPKIAGGVPLPTDFLIGTHALSLVVNQQTSTFTVTEVNEILEKLSEHVLLLTNGTDVIYERQVGFILASYPGWYVGNDNAGTSLVSRSAIQRMVPGDDFEDVLIIGPGSTLAAQLVGGPTSWTTTDDIILDVKLHSWVGLRGQEGVKTGTILGLSDAIDRAQQLGLAA